MLLAAVPGMAAASQDTDDPVAEAVMRLGPVGLTPTFALRDLGVDSNVFNDGAAPARDVVAVMAPGVKAWMRIGRVRLSSTTAAEWAYFQKTVGQRSVNLNQEGRVALQLSRLTPYLEAGYLRSRQRPNLEIDQRVLQKTQSLAAGVLVRVGPRTTLDVGARRLRVDLGDPGFGSALLASRLNRETEQAALEARVTLTSLTTLTAEAHSQRDRFEFDPVRDTDNLVFTAGVELKPSALIVGTAAAGYRQLRARHAATPDHGGLVAAVRVSYILLDQTRFSLTLNRDVDYSFEAAWPYFVATSGLIEIKHAVGFVWDVVTRAGRSDLAYHSFVLPDADLPAASARRDRIVTIGIGAGRHLGDTVRVGVDVNQDRRQSPVAGRSYSGYRFGGSVMYGY